MEEDTIPPFSLEIASPSCSSAPSLTEGSSSLAQSLALGSLTWPGLGRGGQGAFPGAAAQPEHIQVQVAWLPARLSEYIWHMASSDHLDLVVN